MATTTETALALIIPHDLRLPEKEEKELSALVERKLQETKTLTIVSSDEQFEAVGEELRAIAHLRSQVGSAVRPYIAFWHQGHKTPTQLLAMLDGPLEARERSIKQGLSRYQKEKEEARRQEEERLRREMEELRRKLEEEDRRRREMEAEAAAREAEGDHETAELIIEHAVEQTAALPELEPHVPVVLVAPVVQASTPKVRGVGSREVPKWRVQCGHERADDPNCATCRCVPREYLVLDLKRVQAWVNGFGVNANIPGIEVWTECQASVRRKL